jgi:hypothetical protein
VLAPPDRQLSSLILSIRRPSTATDPELGRSIPVIRFRIVVLPLPDGPTTATISPATIDRSTPRKAR